MNFIKRLYERSKILAMWALVGFGAIIMIFETYQLTVLYKKTTVFNLRKIIVKNENILSEDQIIKLSGIKKGTRLMDINLTKALRELNDSPNIASSTIDLIYPATLVINITETEPIAFINFKNELKYVDNKGQIIGKVKADNGFNLPIINSELNENIIKYLNLTMKMSPFLYHQISEIESTDSGIELYLIKSSAHIIVGENDFDKKIVVLENFLKEEYDSIAFAQVDYIDLRFDQQVILKDYAIAEK